MRYLLEFLRERAFGSSSMNPSVCGASLNPPRRGHFGVPGEALRRGWFRGNFYRSPLQGDTLVSAFQSVAIPFRGFDNMYDVNGVIRAAQAVPGVSVAVRSTCTLSATDLLDVGVVMQRNPPGKAQKSIPKGETSSAEAQHADQEPQRNDSAEAAT